MAFLKISQGLERLTFFILIFFLLCHIMACFWIFTAEMSEDQEDEDATTWIISGEYKDKGTKVLYSTALYFTITTITTVGYGDISGTNSLERIICIFLMILGNLFFSFSSGTFAQIISNYE